MSDPSLLDLINQVQSTSTQNSASPVNSMNQLIPASMWNPWWITVSTLFGLIGVFYLSYAKREKQIIPGLIGLALCIYPFFVSSLIWMILIGCFLCLVPWILSRMGRLF